MGRRLDKTSADYLVIAVSPALIMAMVGSLVFFLVEVFYRGQYEGRLHFVLGAFVLAAVLIGRISIEFGAERAAMYAMPLALVTGLAINKFVVDQGGTLGSLGLVLNLGLLGLIWWAAHKLVWDCTLIDETQDSSGEGLLQLAGLDQAKTGQAEEPEKQDEQEPPDESEEDAADPTRPKTWREQLLDAPRPKHAPGVWIVYFSLAALPIFGFGQALIPASGVDQRRYVFKLLLAYVASGLALLLTTSFLGLRRYLRQRRLQMPAAMAGVWIVVGVGLIAAILAFAILVPRPSAEYSLADVAPRLISPEQKASRHAVGKEGADDPRPDRAKVTQDDPTKPKTGPAKESSKENESSTETGAKDGQGKADSGKGEPGKGEPAKGRQGEDKGEPPEGKQGRDQGSDQSKQPADQGNTQPPPKSNSEQPPTQKGQKEPASQSTGKTDRNSKGQPSSKEPVKQPPADGSKQADNEKPAPASQPATSPQAALQEALRWMMILGKWLFYGFLALLVLMWLVRNWSTIAEELRRILEELRGLWQRLFGGKPQAKEKIGEEQAAAVGPPSRRLADFADPFATGQAARLSPDELVRYSFEALEAWARERGCPRSSDETPHEFAQQVGDRDPSLAAESRVLAGLYCRVAYAPGTLPSEQTEPLRKFWRAMSEKKMRDEG